MLLRILPEHPGRHFGGVYVALRVGADAFHAVVVVLLRVGLHERNQRRDLAVTRAAYADASREARVGPAVRLRIGHVNGILRIDEHAARTAELLPLIEKLSVLVEDLDAVVGPIGDEDPSARIDRDAVRQ